MGIWPKNRNGPGWFYKRSDKVGLLLTFVSSASFPDTGGSANQIALKVCERRVDSGGLIGKAEGEVNRVFLFEGYKFCHRVLRCQGGIVCHEHDALFPVEKLVVLLGDGRKRMKRRRQTMAAEVVGKRGIAITQILGHGNGKCLQLGKTDACLVGKRMIARQSDQGRAGQQLDADNSRFGRPPENDCGIDHLFFQGGQAGAALSVMKREVDSWVSGSERIEIRRRDNIASAGGRGDRNRKMALFMLEGSVVLGEGFQIEKAREDLG